MVDIYIDEIKPNAYILGALVIIEPHIFANDHSENLKNFHRSDSSFRYHARDDKVKAKSSHTQFLNYLNSKIEVQRYSETSSKKSLWKVFRGKKEADA